MGTRAGGARRGPRAEFPQVAMTTGATWIRGSAWRLILARMPGGNAASGHVQLRRGARGGVFYLKYRLPDGRQLQHRLGPEWRDSGRPPAGYYTKKSAE